MTTPKMLSVIFSQDAAGVRAPGLGIRKRPGQGQDIRRNTARCLRSDTGRELKRAARHL